ncbi:DUF2087 domain-containing protein [Hyalangium gracile]|uniref:DUF2087 domain-containing protein n=1 Tax=Hyalangium gracile TaxID=394092 RepID=UPI001CCF14B3|nr:DUF2087 domain-containing protein [Hyalangium gracile]
MAPLTDSVGHETWRWREDVNVMRGTAAQPTIHLHTGHPDFNDWALLRRDLYDAKRVDRSPDGRRYWKVAPAS